MEWGEHHACLFHGTERFFRATYNSSLLNAWLPALDGVGAVAARRPGRRCRLRSRCEHDPDGQGLSAVDVRRHRLPRWLDRDGAATREDAWRDQRPFEAADATSYNGDPYDVIAFFDCIHDMADPAGAARHARQSLKPDGHIMAVEPFANDRLEQNLNPVGRFTMARRPWCACRCRWPGRGPRSARRPVSSDCAMSSSTAAGSRDSAAPLRRRSTSSSKRGLRPDTKSFRRRRCARSGCP